MPNRRYNTQVANPMKSGGRVKRMGGGMSTARKDMKSGYYKDCLLYTSPSPRDS